MEKERVILTNWAPSEPVILSSDLGWHKSDYLDAESRDPETVFNFFWRNFNSIVFYYPQNGNFYELFMESEPFKFWKVNQKTDWDGKWVVDRIAWDEHEEGQVLLTFDDDTNLWNILKIDGKPIGEVISQSLIAEINI